MMAIVKHTSMGLCGNMDANLNRQKRLAIGSCTELVVES